ncbi:LPXTG cell wall anchor domain-containing protein [Lacticaseibacillus paracasei]
MPRTGEREGIEASLWGGLIVAISTLLGILGIDRKRKQN